MSDRWDYDSMFIKGAWTADDVVGVTGPVPAEYDQGQIIAKDEL